MLVRVLFWLAAVSIPGIDAHGAGTDLSVHSAWIREAPLGAPALAGYMVIENGGAAPRKLISAKSAAFRAVELHRSVIENDMARMARQAAVSIPPAGGQVKLKPGGYHLMMIKPLRALRAGDKASVVLVFDGDEQLKVRVPVVRAAGVQTPQHHHH
jgi:copper(I)-binding protein